MKTKTINSYQDKHYGYSHMVDYPPFSPQPLHSHTCCEIFCVYSGNGEYITEGARHKLQFGKLFLMRPGEFHMPSLSNNEAYDRLTIHFDLDFIDPIDKERCLVKPFFERPLGTNNVYSRQTLASSAVYEILGKMDKIDTSKQDADVKFKIQFFLLLEEINNLFDHRLYEKNPERTTRISKIIEYINSHITDSLSVNEICDKFYISRSQLNRNFNSLTGSSVWEYITNKRFDLVKQYTNSGMSLVNASSAAGFGDYSAFYRAYTKKYGMSPSKKLNVQKTN